MFRLEITDFSCLRHASIDLSPLTIITGPQSSGKSLVTKLIHFFNDILGSRWITSLEKGQTFKQLEKDCAVEFTKWFPTGAWGNGDFLIRHIVDGYEITARRKRMKTVVDVVEFSFDPFYKEVYKSLFRIIAKERNRSDKDLIENDAEILESLYRMDRLKEHVFGESMPNFVRYQLFIPAGRSFFTSITKAFAVFEAGGYLDPVTLRFGRLFGVWVDSSRMHSRGRARQHSRTFREYMPKVLGGTLHLGKDERFVSSKDGRRVPFHLLSSGQQELIPLWVSLDSFFGIRRKNSLVTIEEPEAHLFPSSQAVIINLLATLINESDKNNKMIITTHSPYILSMINLMVKKSNIINSRENLAEETRQKLMMVDEKILGELDSIVLPSNFVAAYAVQGGKLVSIIDDEGLIDAKYLDEISFEVESAMNDLFDIEFWLSQTDENSDHERIS